jgi:hypothetical protein
MVNGMIRVSITTYNRNEMVTRLVDALAGPGVDIHVYDDGSDNPVVLPRATVHRYDENGGRTWWYTRVGDLFTDACVDESWDYMLWIADDVYPKRDDMLEYLQAEFETLIEHDPKTVCLNPFKMKNHPCAQWTGFEPVLRHGHYQTQWMDCGGFFARRFAHIARQAMRRVAPRYDYPGNNLGTGVGRMISHVSHELGYHLYQVPESLLSHDNHPSRLSPDKDPIPFIVE